MGDEVIGSRGNQHKAIELRGRRNDEWPGRTARDLFPELEPNPEELKAWLEPKPASSSEPPDLHLQFFRDLLAVQGSEPLSPERAAAIRRRSGLSASNVTDPAAREAALLGFELVLTVASIIPSPVAGFATGALVLIAIVRGKSGPSVAAAAVPIGRLANAGKVIRALMKLGRVFRPTTIQEYRAVARLLLMRDRNLSQLNNTIVNVTEKLERKAAEAATVTYKRVLHATSGNKMEAARQAGDAFHQAVGAGGAGVDRVVYKGGEFFIEYKTHYVPIVDELVLRGGKEQVLAYVLKNIVEKGAAPQARVVHVFIDPYAGKAVKLALDPLNGQNIVDALLRLGRKK
ncbi:MAG: hypothetical protein L0312_33685 [Acidobacteria bacterium]|nr:hypothetical protein [Acidobacteriota bacterium]